MRFRTQTLKKGNYGTFNRAVAEKIGLAAASLLDELIYLNDLFVDVKNQPSYNNDNQPGFTRTYGQLADVLEVSKKTVRQKNKYGLLQKLTSRNLVKVSVIIIGSKKITRVNHFALNKKNILLFFTQCNEESKARRKEEKDAVGVATVSTPESDRCGNGFHTTLQSGVATVSTRSNKLYTNTNSYNEKTKNSKKKKGATPEVRACSTGSCDIPKESNPPLTNPPPPVVVGDAMLEEEKRAETKIKTVKDAARSQFLNALEHIDDKYGTQIDIAIAECMVSSNIQNSLLILYETLKSAAELPAKFKPSQQDLDLLHAVVTHDNLDHAGVGAVYDKILASLAKISLKHVKRFGDVTADVLAMLDHHVAE